MIERHQWLNVILQTRLNHILVMRQRKLIHRSLPKGEDSRPRDREGVIRHAERGDAGNIWDGFLVFEIMRRGGWIFTLLIHVILIITHIARIIRHRDTSSPMRIDIPNRRAPPLIRRRPLDLIRRRRNTPPEALGKFPALVLGD